MKFTIKATGYADYAGFAKIQIVGLSGETGDMKFRLARQSEYRERILGPDGWQVAETLLAPDFVGYEDGGIVLQVGPAVCQHLGANTYEFAIPGANVTGVVFWPDIALIRSVSKSRFRGSAAESQSPQGAIRRPPPPPPVPRRATEQPVTSDQGHPGSASPATPVEPDVTPAATIPAGPDQATVPLEPTAELPESTLPTEVAVVPSGPVIADKPGVPRDPDPPPTTDPDIVLPPEVRPREPFWTMMRIGALLSVVLLLLAVAGGAAVWFMRPVDTALACAATFDEQDGIVTVAFNDESRASRRIKVTADGIAYSADFDAAGHLRLQVPLFHAEGDISWPANGGTICHHRQSFPGFAKAFISAIEWKGTLDLALHVVEPGGFLGGTDHYLSAARTNQDSTAGEGRIVSFGEPDPDTSRVQMYVLPAGRIRPAGDIRYYVEFKSRGNPTRAPYCGSAADAAPTVRFMHVSDGQPPAEGVSDFLHTLRALPCDHYVPRNKLDGEYYEKLSPGG